MSWSRGWVRRTDRRYRDDVYARLDERLHPDEAWRLPLEYLPGRRLAPMRRQYRRKSRGHR